MPYINSKVTGKIDKVKEHIIKKRLGKAIELINGKSEEWLMINFENDCSLYFKGYELTKGAIIEVKIFGSASKEEYDRLTTEISNIYLEEIGIPTDKIYITYEEIKTWGWNKHNF